MPDPQRARLIAGRKPVLEALEREAARIEKVMLKKGAGGGEIGAIRQAAEGAGVPVQYVPEGRLRQEARGANHQGAVAFAAPVAYRSFEGMLAEIAPSWDAVQAQKPMLLAIDRVTDPHNFGAILRSAVAAGADGVVVPKAHMAPLSAVAVKASAGMARRIPIARVESLPEALQQLKERSYWVLGADGGGDTSVWDADWDRPVALVIGSEGRGLRREVAAACDVRVAIPLRGPAESLNASVAAGILLFAAARVRG